MVINLTNSHEGNIDLNDPKLLREIICQRQLAYIRDHPRIHQPIHQLMPNSSEPKVMEVFDSPMDTGSEIQSHNNPLDAGQIVANSETMKKVNLEMCLLTI